MKAGDTGARAEREADGGGARIPSRAAAAAQRRINASAARRRARCEVLLTTSKDVTPAQYQQLLNFVKGLQLPPDATALVTTVSADQFVATTSSSNLNPSVPAAEGQSAQQRAAILAASLERLSLGPSADESGHASPENMRRDGHRPSYSQGANGLPLRRTISPPWGHFASGAGGAADGVGLQSVPAGRTPRTDATVAGSA